MKQNRLYALFEYMMIGIAFGAIAITLSLYVNFGMNDMLKQIIVWLVASAIIGLVSMIYESDYFTNITATIVHAPITCVVALISGWILDYGDGSVSLLLIRMLPSIVVLYAAIHLILFLFRRTAAQDINARLKK